MSTLKIVMVSDLLWRLHCGTYLIASTMLSLLSTLAVVGMVGCKCRCHCCCCRHCLSWRSVGVSGGSGDMSWDFTKIWSQCDYISKSRQPIFQS